MADILVEYSYITGRPQDIISSVLRSVSANTRKDRVRYFKIGITNGPERRFRQEYINNYDKMLVIYKSTSLKYVSELERELIKHNQDLADNIIGGGGGNYGDSPYFMYVVIKYIKKKKSKR